MTFSETLGSANLCLFNIRGRLLFQLDSDLNLGENLFTGPLKDSELAEAFERARILIQPTASDYQLYPGLREPTLFIASPVLRSGAIVGVIVLQLRNSEFYQVFSNYNGLGNTGETMVAIRRRR